MAGALREAGLAVRPDGSARRLGKQLEAAARVGAGWAVIVGDELAEGRVTLKDLASGEQAVERIEDVAARIGA